jgi:hypothetical protein
VRFARHWARAAQSATGKSGQRFDLAAWGWSDTDAASAEAMARDALRRIAERVARGEAFPARYAYGDRPLREELLGEPHPDVALTRNGYGCEVLNAARVMFVDIDLPEPKSAGLVGRLLGRKPAPDAAEAALTRVHDWLRLNGDWGFRAYRTKAGLRLLATHGPVPVDARALELMGALGADPLYVRLCKAQASFRARLTPKPWRCGTHAPGVRWPFPDAAAERRFRDWRTEYENLAQRYATCTFLRTLGNADVHPEVVPIRELHDERTRAGSGLPLA